VYAPAHAPLLNSIPVSESQSVHLVIAFEEPFDLSSNCTDALYSCLLAVGSGGMVQAGSAQQLDVDGMLYQASKALRKQLIRLSLSVSVQVRHTL